MADIGVIHLVRAKNGLAPFQQFLSSYTDNPGGMAHDLIVVFKGFPHHRLPQEYTDLLPQNTQRLFVSDAGFDITAYFAAANQLEHRYLCFLNSYSSFRDSEWLAKLSGAISADRGVGLVGASGSWASVYSLQNDDKVKNYLSTNSRSFRESLATPFRRCRYYHYFDPFPNYHLRSNAFLISRPLMHQIRCRPLRRKLDALRFESGKNSLTRQVQRMGLQVLVVGRDGNGYVKEEWDRSNALWQADQPNLLVADNQTKKYQDGDFGERQFLSWSAWGDHARPKSD